MERHLGNDYSDASIQYVDQSGHNREGLNQRRPGFSGIAKIPKNLVRIVSSHSRSPNGGDQSDELSPPQETLSKITIPTT